MSESFRLIRQMERWLVCLLVGWLTNQPTSKQTDQPMHSKILKGKERRDEP
jgi:hypothetical protein